MKANLKSAHFEILASVVASLAFFQFRKSYDLLA